MSLLSKYIDMFIDIQKSINKSNGFKKVVIFRGQKNDKFDLYPSVFRDGLINSEYRLINEFLLSSPDDFFNTNSYFEKLVKMQHYGLPTRLLDFTLNPLIALYFACEKKECDGEVFITVEELLYPDMDIVEIISANAFLGYEDEKLIRVIFPHNDFMNYIHSGYREFTIGKLKECFTPNYIAVLPHLNNERIKRQQGIFLLFNSGDNTSFNLKEKLCNSSEYGFNCVIKIPAKEKMGLITELNHIGINKSFIFPELEKKAESLKEKYNH